MAAALFIGSAPAMAAGPGYGDVSDAMIYGTSGPVGAVVPEFIDNDDDYTTVASPFPINFFGNKYDALCLTTNGTISPVPTTADGCSDNYDLDLANLAIDAAAPLIGALALDLDPSEDLWVPGVSVVSFSVTSNVATITTAAPHGFAIGDDFTSWFDPNDPTFGEDQSGTITSVPTPTSFTFAFGSPDEATRAVVGGTVSIGEYDDTRDDTDADGLADDGFGAVKQVYFGTTVVGGKQAVVITWYRVPTNDTNNSPLLSNTLQIVLIQEPTATGATDGYDFTIQLNIGTATDNDDGYSAADPTDSCDGDAQGIDDCRWGMGWVDYDATTQLADAYELFPNSPINTLVDSGGSTSLVQNRLNSDVLGRYTWKMVGGVTVGFAAPPMDGTDVGTLPDEVVAPPAPAPAAAAPTLPATGTDGWIVGLGGGVLIVLGVTATVLGRRRDAVRA